MATVFIALGSNLANPLQQVENALTTLSRIPHSQLIAVSPFYRSKPLGPQDQPDYLNAVVQLESELPPEALLDETQSIEQQQGRERKDHRWGPRTLDLDILLYDKQVINTPRLTIPHYDMKKREFMLYPLFDIAPELIFPDGIKLADLLNTIPINGMTKW